MNLDFNNEPRGRSVQAMINEKRMVTCFKELVGIDSVSWEEGAVCAEIRKIFDQLDVTTVIDEAGRKANGDTGNLIAKFKGNTSAPPLLLSAHMDTVEPGRGIVPVVDGDTISSRDNTILGADDKSAIAVILEVLHCIKENDLPCGPLEIVFTICEEVGMHGAKNLDYSTITADCGYVLDSSDTEKIINRAPASKKFDITIHGKAAHAGFSPESGINAISVASKAIASLNLGRIDEETTSNIGLIDGGIATNIVPEQVRVKGEVRSHNPEKLARITKEILDTFESVVKTYRQAGIAEGLPKIETTVTDEYPHTCIAEDHPVIAMATEAASNLNRHLEPVTTGGGADANIFFSRGITTGVLGTGMCDVHTVDENIRISDMVRSAQLLLEIIGLHSQKERQVASK